MKWLQRHEIHNGYSYRNLVVSVHHPVKAEYYHNVRRLRALLYYLKCLSLSKNIKNNVFFQSFNIQPTCHPHYTDWPKSCNSITDQINVICNICKDQRAYTSLLFTVTLLQI